MGDINTLVCGSAGTKFKDGVLGAGIGLLEGLLLEDSPQKLFLN